MATDAALLYYYVPSSTTYIVPSSINLLAEVGLNVLVFVTYIFWV